MNLTVTQMEQQFVALKTGDISADSFFNSIVAPLAVVKGAAATLLNDVHRWALENESLSPHTLGLSTISLGLLAMHEDRLEDGLKFASDAQKIFTDINNDDGLALSNTIYTLN